MPFVNIKITNEGVSADQKAELINGVTDLLSTVLGKNPATTVINGVTDLLSTVLGKNPATTVVVIEEVDTDNWGIGGEAVTVRRKRGQ